MADLPSTGRWSPRHHERAQAEGYGSWTEWCEVLEEDKGFKICGAWTKSKRRPCLRPAGDGTDHPKFGRCKSHGGASLVGDAAPNYQGKGQSKYLDALKGKSREAFQQFLDDPDYASLREEIAHSRVVLYGFLAEWPEDLATLDEVVDAIDDLENAIQSGEPERLVKAIKDFRALIHPVRLAFTLKQEIREEKDILRKLLSSELKRNKTEYEQVPLPQLHMWSEFWLKLLLEFVRDEDDRQTIINRVRAFTG